MEHQKEIAYQRIRNLQNGAHTAEQMVKTARQMLNRQDIEIGDVQTELAEIQDFLLWLASQ